MSSCYWSSRVNIQKNKLHCNVSGGVTLCSPEGFMTGCAEFQFTLMHFCFDIALFFFPPTNCHNKKIPFALKLQSVFLVFLFFGGKREGLLPVDEGEGKKEKKKTSCQKGWAGAAANCGSVRVRWITKKPQKRAQLSNPKQANFEWNSTIWDCDVDCLPPINLF